MLNRKSEMSYFNEDDSENGKPEGSTSEARASEEKNMEISREEEKVFKITEISASSCTALPQIHPCRVGVSLSVSNVLNETHCSIVECIPSRSVTHLTSLIDLSGSGSGCGSNYPHSGRIFGKATAVALQVPASPLHEPSLTVSAVAASVVHVATTSRSFFSPFGNTDSRLPEVGRFGRCTVTSTVVECSSMPVESRMEQNNEQNASTRGEGRVNNEIRNVGIAQRLTELLQGATDGDLLLQQTENENGMLQWLQALDLQVMGACRADERLRPMLQLNVSCSGADDRLLAQLSQLFKPRELGMLFRCLFVPLVSVRVGKVIKQDTKLCPTSTRGHLSLTLLPCSDLRLSFAGDNGNMEKLAVLSAGDENSSVVIEEISADVSGRSFLLKFPGGKVEYFWQSERSKLVGDELISKMKNLLRRRPSLAQLTGIRESRLDSFATYLRTSFLGSTSSSTQEGPVSSLHNVNRASSTSGPSNSSNASASFQRPSQHMRLGLSQPIMHGGLQSSNQGSSLSARAGAFKDGVIRNVSCMRSVTAIREKLKRRMDDHSSIYLSGTPNISALQTLSNLENCRTEVSHSSSTVPNPADLVNHLSGDINAGKHNSPLPQRFLHFPVSNINVLLPSQQSASVGEPSFDPFAFHLPVSSRVSLANSSIFAPHYCPCPLRPSSLQYTITPPFLPSLSNEAVSLPPATSYFNIGSSSAFIPPLPLDLHNSSFSPISLPVPSLVNIPTPLQTSNLPSFLSDPVVRVPLPVSSFVTVPTPQKVTTFTPFFSDPIVHIPMIDFDTSGNHYLVSAGPSIPSAISPILPSLLSTLIPKSSSLDEKDEANALQLLTKLGFQSPWRASEGENCSTNFPTGAFYVSTSSRPLSAQRNIAEGSCSHLEAESSGETDSPYEFTGVRLGNPGLQNHVKHSIPSHQQSGPLIGMAPAILTSSSLSCLFDICQEAKPKLTTLVTGSRGLYGGSWDPVVSSTFLAGINQRSAIQSDANMQCHLRNDLARTQNIDGLLRLDEAASEDERSKREGEDKEDSGR